MEAHKGRGKKRWSRIRAGLAPSRGGLLPFIISTSIQQNMEMEIWCLVTKLCLILATPWTAACQAPLSMGFPRQEYWSGLPFPSPGDLPNPGTEPVSPALAGRFITNESPRMPCLLTERMNEQPRWECPACDWMWNAATQKSGLDCRWRYQGRQQEAEWSP